MATVEEVLFRLEAQTARYEAGMSRATQTMRRFDAEAEARTRRVQGHFDRLGTSITRSFRTLIPAISVGILGRMTRDAIEFADQIGVAADRLGVTAEQLQVFRFAAEDAANIGVQQADNALQRFTRQLAEAQAGTGELINTFRQYNVELFNADGTTRSATDVLRDYADVVQSAGSEQEQLRLAYSAFGREGVGLVNLLRQGSEGMDAFGDAAREAGILTNEQVDQAQDLDAELTRLSQTIRTELTAALIDIGPVLVGVIEAIAWAIRQARELIDIINNIGSGRPALVFPEMIGEALVPFAELGAAYERALREAEARGPTASVDMTTPEFQAATEQFNRTTGQNLSLAQAADQARQAFENGIVMTPEMREQLYPTEPPPRITAGEPPPPVGGSTRTERDGGADFVNRQSYANALLLDRIAALQELDPVQQRIVALEAEWANRLAEQGDLTDEARAAIPELAAEYVALTDQLERAQEVQHVVNEALRAGVDNTELYAEAMAVLQERYDAGMISAEQFAAAQQHINEQIAETPSWAKDAAGAFTDMFGAIITGEQSAEEALLGFAQRLAELIIQITILQPLAEALSATLSGLGGGGGGGIGGFLGGLFGGGRAHGGPVYPGKAYVVGEKRPELFVPQVPGRIVPQVPARSGGGSITIAMPVSINAPGADPRQLAALTSEVRGLKQALPAVVTGVVREEARRGGTFARDVGRR